ncbi:MAG TPA: hypothetical protein VK603_13735, partial [Candidatus Saccharimonadales bacterium]|nr:hypothetical protein [Candidatus Saccharimonadales bacterium]
ARERLSALQCDADCRNKSVEDTNPVMPPAGSTHSYRRYVLVISALTSAVLFTWSGQIEFYPFTSVQMFTSKRDSVVTYYKVIGHWESGITGKAYFEDALGAWSINSRYESLFTLCFGKPTELEVCRKSLAVLGAAYNKKVSPKERLAAYELQRWTWDFRSHPSDPQYGHLDARLIYNVNDRSR